MRKREVRAQGVHKDWKAGLERHLFFFWFVNDKLSAHGQLPAIQDQTIVRREHLDNRSTQQGGNST